MLAGRSKFEFVDRIYNIHCKLWIIFLILYTYIVCYLPRGIIACKDEVPVRILTTIEDWESTNSSCFI